MITLYGIKSCDTVRKARRWLEDHGVEYHYHDLREDGLNAAQVQAWLDELGTDALLNRRSTTWKALPETTRQTLDASNTAALILEQPTLIKRPLLDTGTARHTGFSASGYQHIFNEHTL